jgi:hypothetical protein
MIYILLFALFLMMLIIVFISNADIISPWFISVTMYTISVFFVILNRDNWSIELAPMTVFIIISALLAFGLGEIVC